MDKSKLYAYLSIFFGVISIPVSIFSPVTLISLEEIFHNSLYKIVGSTIYEIIGILLLIIIPVLIPILGIVFGVISYKKGAKHALVGIILNCIGFVISIIVIYYLFRSVCC